MNTAVAHVHAIDEANLSNPLLWMTPPRSAHALGCILVSSSTRLPSVRPMCILFPAPLCAL